MKGEAPSTPERVRRRAEPQSPSSASEIIGRTRSHSSASSKSSRSSSTTASFARFSRWSALSKGLRHSQTWFSAEVVFYAVHFIFFSGTASGSSVIVPIESGFLTIFTLRGANGPGPGQALPFVRASPASRQSRAGLTFSASPGRDGLAKIGAGLWAKPG